MLAVGPGDRVVRAVIAERDGSRGALVESDRDGGGIVEDYAGRDRRAVVVGDDFTVGEARVLRGAVVIEEFDVVGARIVGQRRNAAGLRVVVDVHLLGAERLRRRRLIG